MAETISYDLQATVEVAATPAEVYRVASDITRMGEWSPECVGGEWTTGEPGAVGARFRGHNRRGDRSWSADCEVVAAEPGRRFSWAVLSNPSDPEASVWSFEIEPTSDGCVLTQRYRMKSPPARLLAIRDSLPPEEAATFAEFRRGLLEEGMRQTLDGIRKSVEG
ncbi:SRPBCC family protein [Saccharopolyspora sp. NPDC000359]|uniref:SRPBCC family protein n=1 Tax=Saccharopolyspora sp. NPDC000359 TaxID=3154251 RepID=UPI00332FD518